MTKKLTKEQKKMWAVLKVDVQNADFKKFREANEYLWLTKERELYWIEDMETSHIINCINMLERVDQQYTKSYKGLVNELRSRIGVDATYENEI